VSTESLLVDEREGVVTYTLNRPDRMNALSSSLARELDARIAADQGRASVRAMVITGAGDRAFCAGTDLKERQDFDVDEMDSQRRDAWQLNRTLLHCSKPTIAAIRGWCLGGGLELALSCDLRYASDSAVFAFPEMERGSFPGAGGPYLLSRLFGYARAAELLLLPRRRSAAEMREIGLVNLIASDDALLEAVAADASRLVRMNPHAISAIKQLMWAGMERTLEDVAVLNDHLHPQARKALLEESSAKGERGDGK
jgi:enoyl-CoA hydratase/carnithine racemase